MYERLLLRCVVAVVAEALVNKVSPEKGDWQSFPKGNYAQWDFFKLPANAIEAHILQKRLTGSFKNTPACNCDERALIVEGCVMLRVGGKTKDAMLTRRTKMRRWFSFENTSISKQQQARRLAPSLKIWSRDFKWCFFQCLLSL